MLTELREAKGPRKQKQILAIASLSSPHFDANPFLAASDKVPGFPVFSAASAWRSDGAGTVLVRICRYSNHICRMGRASR